MKGRIFGLLVGVLVTAQYCLVADAADTSVNKAGTSSCSVSMATQSTWNATIPKKLTLDKSTGSCAYEISCSGDIGYADVIMVEPQSSFVLSDGSSSTLQATVAQDITQFVRTDRDVNTNQSKLGEKIQGVVTASEVKPGQWNGSFNFNISCTPSINVVLTVDNASDLGIKFSGDVVIPESYEKDNIIYTITGIADGLFSADWLHPEHTVNAEDQIVSIVFPNTITDIGALTFYACDNLLSVQLPSNLKTIKPAAFSLCHNLSNIDLPGSITNIEGDAFFNCAALTSIVIPNSVVNIGEDAFGYCDGLTTVIIPIGVENIDPLAFEECTVIENIDIPSSVTSIGTDAFKNVKHITNNSSCIDGSPWGALSVN